MTRPAEHIKKHATLSDDGVYRYWLERSWAETGRGFVNFIMLNPSTADAENDDPTIRRCIDFARRWGYDGMHVVNLFGLRATDPKALKSSARPVGPENSVFIEAGLLSAEVTVCAWGAHGAYLDRAPAVVQRAQQLAKGKTFALAINKDGSPKHPLYVPADTELVAYPPEQPT